MWRFCRNRQPIWRCIWNVRISGKPFSWSSGFPLQTVTGQHAPDLMNLPTSSLRNFCHLPSRYPWWDRDKQKNRVNPELTRFFCCQRCLIWHVTLQIFVLFRKTACPCSRHHSASCITGINCHRQKPVPVWQEIKWRESAIMIEHSKYYTPDDVAVMTAT